ncbi:NAC domain-containing protein 72 [Brachypodium distachyon]|uniref:NAC domain-containing protein n=1 Tax=Brachypodium distachyon TaxID=15368 RepID=A0A0Q3FE61_BRADI|nr:NAC domain-containing protein 72 [Brachypodium distachyon]KQJ97887.1 hypothetical protein BRADI_3g33957v3 [Brachypodium distachyon]|eukprot:XP_010235019.2 NAC domain-containing protein 72 [Brachypodium distachyon]
MGTMTLPPGFRFHPTDDELVGYYLKRRVDNLKIELEVIPVIDLYKFEPWELPEKSFLPKKDLEWFFFVPRDRKYPNGSRTNRATTTGYWKATGKDRKVSCDGGAVCGVRKTLVFYRGRAPGGERTDWVMHEYRLCQDLSLHGASVFLGAYALCRVVKRSEAGLINGDAAAKAMVPAVAGKGARMSKVASSSSLVTADHQQPSNGSSPFTPSPTRLDIIGGGGGTESWRDMAPAPLCFPPQQEDAAFFVGGTGDLLFPSAAGECDPFIFGDIGGGGGALIPENELRWDNFPSTNNGFPATGGFMPSSGAGELWNPAPPNAGGAPLLCRQASDGIDDLTAWFSPVDENMVVF